MLSKEQAVKIFTESGALMEGHFKLTSGRHSNRYMQCAQVLQYLFIRKKYWPAIWRKNLPVKKSIMWSDRLWGDHRFL